MTPTDPTDRTPRRRSGADTRARVCSVALRLFTEHGYEATSLRRIADELGINKASLYYYFPSKEAILQSLVDQRGLEAEELLGWLRRQPRSPHLVEEAVLRWVGSFSTEKLHGIRFLTANPRLDQILDGGGDRIGSSLQQFADELTALLPSATAQQALLLRMAVLSLNAAVQAAAGTGAADEDVVAAAQQAARALVTALSGLQEPASGD